MNEKQFDDFVGSMSEQKLKHINSLFTESKEYKGYLYDSIRNHFELIKKTDWYDIIQDYEDDDIIEDWFFTYVDDVFIVFENPEHLDNIVPLLIEYKKQLEGNDDDRRMNLESQVDKLTSEYSIGYDIYNDTKTEEQKQIGKEIEEELNREEKTIKMF